MSTTVMLSIGVLVAGLLGSVIFYYIIDTQDKKTKKYQLDQVLNVIIQLILYVWAAKIIVQIDVFIRDPISVLAYPSNSTHFFIATMLLIIHLTIKYRKNKVAGAALFQTSSFIFLSALLLYDFFQMFAKTGASIDSQTILLTALVVSYVLLYTKYNAQLLGMVLIGIFLIAACIMAFFKGYFMLFGYMMGPYYYLLLLILLAVYYRFNKHKLLA